MKTYSLLFLLLMLPALAFCQSARKTKATANTNVVDSATQKPNGVLVPMNECNITAVIKSLYPPAIDGIIGTACDTLPCEADIEIKAVNGVGMAFSVNLNPGLVIASYFTFTLVPTEKILPTLIPPLPGLKAGDVFNANIETRNMPGGGFKFYITTYDKMSKN